MKNGKRIGLVLVVLFLTAIIGAGSAMPVTSYCEILETPDNIKLTVCLEDCIIIHEYEGTLSQVTQVKFLETPIGEIDSNIYQQLVEQKTAVIIEKYGNIGSVIPLPTGNSINVTPRDGIYRIRINDTYNIRVRYTSAASLYIKGSWEGIALCGGIILLLAGFILLKFTKYKRAGKACMAIGAILGIIFLYLFTMV